MIDELRGMDETRQTYQITCKDGFSKLWTVDKPAVDDYKTKKYGRLIGKCVDRLAAYEDTGLTPEQIARLQSELAEARERLTAAEVDLKRCNWCFHCKSWNDGIGGCPRKELTDINTCRNWKWRGPQGREGAGNE